MFRSDIFYKGVLIPKEDKIAFASCFFTNLDFLFPHTEQVDFNINLPFFCFNHFSIFIVCVFSATYTVSMHAYFL